MLGPAPVPPSLPGDHSRLGSWDGLVPNIQLHLQTGC